MKRISIAVLLASLVASATFACACEPSGVEPAPAPTEVEDCDEEDRAKREWQECGLSVLIQTTAPAAKPKTTAPTRPTPTKRK